MFILGCIAVLALVVSVLCVGVTFVLLYQYYNTAIALEGLIRYTAESTGIDENEVRKIVIKAKRKI